MAQLVAHWLSTMDVVGLIPGKGDNFVLKNLYLKADCKGAHSNI